MIFHHLEKFHFSSLFDPLSSTSGGSGYFKLQHVRVVSNDPSWYFYVRGKALWENNSFYIPDSTIDEVCAYNEGDLAGLVRYTGFEYPHLTDEMKAFLDLWHIRIHRETDEYIQSLLCTGVLLCVDYWITMYENGSQPSFDPPSLLKYYLNHVNRQVMNNHESNEMWRENPHDLVGKVLCDVMYLNPPPLKGYASFGLRERIGECWMRGDTGFNMADITKPGTLGGHFNTSGEFMEALRGFLEKSSHIHLWVIALSNRQPFTQVEMMEMLRGFGRKVVSVDIELPKGFFSQRAVNSVAVASG
jgi:hypothetical protein